MKLTHLLFLLFFSNILHANISNFSQVSKNIYRGSWLYNKDDDFTELKKIGVTYIINMEYFFKENQLLCKKHDITCENHPLFILPYYDKFFDDHKLKQVYHRVISLVKNKEKVYIHCLHGSDRTGALSSALIIREKTCNNQIYDKESLKKEIKLQLKTHGFHKRFFPFLYKKIISWTKDRPEWICDDNK